MAPRRVPRSSRNLPHDCPPRNRLARLAVDTDETFSEVPDYLVCPKAKTKRELMKRAAILKAGVTGYGCPPGYSGVIVYPLSELEKELLNSMGAERAPQAPQEEVPVPGGEVLEVAGGPGVLMGQPLQVAEGGVQEVGGP